MILKRHLGQFYNQSRSQSTQERGPKGTRDPKGTRLHLADEPWTRTRVARVQGAGSDSYEAPSSACTDLRPAQDPPPTAWLGRVFQPLSDRQYRHI